MTSLDAVLSSRRWVRHEAPFPYLVARNVLTPAAYGAVEREFERVLARGLGAPDDRERFSRNMPNSDAYSWNLPPDLSGSLELFYDRRWHDMLAALLDVPATGDVNGALHHHPPATRDGSVHRDLAVGWFSRQARADGVNPMDLRRCSYVDGTGPAGVERREQVRAVTMILYLCNPPWSPGDGGETGLYQGANDPVHAPVAAIPPHNNSILVFENTPNAYHSFLSNRRTPRNSIILWLHRTMADAGKRWGASAVGRW